MKRFIHHPLPLLGAVGSANTEGWTQIGELGLALVLSALIGLEREIRQKSAGLRTHTLVGLGAALFMLVSKYGFNDVLSHGITADPSRVAAQIVSGVGFLGAGIIFVRSDAVRGLTTAAAVWVTAAIGSSAGAGLPLLALAATLMYLVVAVAFTPIVRALPRSSTATSVLRVSYLDGRGALRRVLSEATCRGSPWRRSRSRRRRRRAARMPTERPTGSWRSTSSCTGSRRCTNWQACWPSSTTSST